MKSIVKKGIILLLILLLSAVFGAFLAIKNTSDYNSTDMNFSEITAEVKVYRDNKGIPTIIAQNEADLYFAQGYEMARDRLWQLEFLRSVGSGELSELIGISLNVSDIYLRTLSMSYIAEFKYNLLPDNIKKVLERFSLGVNAYIETHLDNLPLEFAILGATPKMWRPQDILSIQGVMSRTLSISGMNRELFRFDLAKAVGAERALELFPIDSKEGADYYRNYNYTSRQALSNFEVQAMVENVISFPGYEDIVGSNNWVVSADKSATGNPILANDPHLDLQTPGIWWQVQLITPELHVQGFSLPGTPGIIIGHNSYVSWGVTNTGTDAIDLFYFNTNDKNQYYFNNSWVDFEIDTLEIKGNGGETVSYGLRRTVYGPVLDTDIFGTPEGENEVYVMRWTLLDENNTNEQIFRAMYLINRAKNVDDIHEALRYWGVPGQNIVFATVDGDIGYQYTGHVPIRRTPGSGVIPQNGSSNAFGWDGYQDYEDQYFVVNPAKGFFATANQKIDTREDFYITDSYAPDFRGRRINDVLTADTSVTIDDMKALQNDVKTLFADMVLDGFVLDELNKATFSGDYASTLETAVEYLNDWDRSMDRESIGATIYGAMRVYLGELTFSDELNGYEDNFFSRYGSTSNRGLMGILDNKTSIWYDDISTTEVETGADMAIKALEKAVEFLSDKIGANINSWEYGKVHKVYFRHVMGESLSIFDEGKIASDGSSYTVKAAGGTPEWRSSGPNFEQDNGPSMRYISEVESTWSEVYGILVPGESGHLFNSNRGDSVQDWVDNEYHQWDFVTSIDGRPDFTYRKE